MWRRNILTLDEKKRRLFIFAGLNNYPSVTQLSASDMEQFSSSFLLDVVGIYFCRQVGATRYALYWLYSITYYRKLTLVLIKVFEINAT